MSIYTSSAQPSRNDFYETPAATLDMILRYLDPTQHFIWEPFKGSGNSTKYMRSRGFTVSNGDDPDFFKQNIPRIEGMQTVLVSNPPFSIKRQILAHLKSIGMKHIALLLPAPVLFTKYFRDCSENVQVVIHTKRCRFLDPLTGEQGGTPSFDVLWICHGMNLPKDLLFSE